MLLCFPVQRSLYNNSYTTEIKLDRVVCLGIDGLVVDCSFAVTSPPDPTFNTTHCNDVVLGVSRSWISFYTPFFRWNILWYSDVCPSVCPSIQGYLFLFIFPLNSFLRMVMSKNKMKLKNTTQHSNDTIRLGVWLSESTYWWV